MHFIQYICFYYIIYFNLISFNSGRVNFKFASAFLIVVKKQAKINALKGSLFD